MPLVAEVVGPVGGGNTDTDTGAASCRRLEVSVQRTVTRHTCSPTAEAAAAGVAKCAAIRAVRGGAGETGRARPTIQRISVSLKPLTAFSRHFPIHFQLCVRISIHFLLDF